jgi:hypothetical protein
MKCINGPLEIYMNNSKLVLGCLEDNQKFSWATSTLLWVALCITKRKSLKSNNGQQTNRRIYPQVSAGRAFLIRLGLDNPKQQSINFGVMAPYGPLPYLG